MCIMRTKDKEGLFARARSEEEEGADLSHNRRFWFWDHMETVPLLGGRDATTNGLRVGVANTLSLYVDTMGPCYSQNMRSEVGIRQRDAGLDSTQVIIIFYPTRRE